MQHKRKVVVVIIALLLSTASLPSATASTTNKTSSKAAAAKAAAAKAAAAKAAAKQSAQWANAAAAALTAADADNAALAAYQGSIDVFANSVPLYLDVAASYKAFLLTTYPSLADFQKAITAVQNDLQARQIDTGRKLDSLLASALKKMNADITAASKVRGPALGAFEAATAVLPGGGAEHLAQVKVAAASAASGAQTDAAIKAADAILAQKEQLMTAASDAIHALDPAMSQANTDFMNARAALIACCGTQGVSASPEVATAASNKMNAAKAALDALSLEYDVKLYTDTAAWAEFNAARYNDFVISLSGNARTTAIWVAFHKAAYEAYSAPSSSARDAIWNAYLSSTN